MPFEGNTPSTRTHTYSHGSHGSSPRRCECRNALEEREPGIPAEEGGEEGDVKPVEGGEVPAHLGDEEGDSRCTEHNGVGLVGRPWGGGRGGWGGAWDGYDG